MSASRRPWMAGLLLAGAILGAACARKERPRPAAADPDEQIVAAFEEMGRIADRYSGDCERWADEQRRLIGSDRIAEFNRRMLSQTAEQRAAFHAKYASRIDPWQEKVARISERCSEELQRALDQPIRVYARPDGG